MNADMADAELKASGFHSAEIPRKPAIGYKFSDVLAFEARWRELKSKREKEHAEDLKRWAEADARLQRKQAEADKLVADTLTKDRSRVR